MTEPTPAQTLLLWCLLGRHGRAPQGALTPEVKKADREGLAAAGLIAVEKAGRSFVLTVTDRGWDWSSGHLDAPLPPAFAVLGDWLGRVSRHLDATGATLADLIGPAPEAEKPDPPPGRAARKPSLPCKPAAPRGKAAPEQKSAPKPPGPKKLRARIEAAYLALTGGARARAVRLAALRAELADLDRATVDAGLARILKKDATARLIRINDPKALTPAEREAAFSPAGEPFHTLWIQ